MIGVLVTWQIARLLFHLGAVREGAPFTGDFAPGLLPFHILLLQKFAPVLGWNNPSWSIGVEWWTYVAFALIAAPIAIRRSPLITAAVLILPWFALTVTHRSIGVGGDATIACMMNFGLGLIVCDMRSWRLWRITDRIDGGGASLIEVITVALGLWMIASFGGKLSPLIGPTFAFMIAVFSLERGWISRALTTGPMLLLGELSYSIYMIHHFILDRMCDALWAFGGALGLPISITSAGRTVLVGDPLACDLFSLTILAIVIVLSRLSYRYVENEARLWSRRVLNPNHRERVTPPDPIAAF